MRLKGALEWISERLGRDEKNSSARLFLAKMGEYDSFRKEVVEILPKAIGIGEYRV